MLIKLLKHTSILENRYLHLSLIYLLSFSIPFLLQGPQLLVGSTINFILILGVSLYNIKLLIPALILPSVSVYIYNVLFQGATGFLLYLIPFIVISNVIYLVIFKKIKIDYLDISLAAILKAAFLFVCTYILTKTIDLPEIFLTVMGINQLITALIGGFLAKGVIQATD